MCVARRWSRKNEKIPRFFKRTGVNRGCRCLLAIRFVIDAARRELLEETGYAAGNLIHLGTWECNPALQTNRLHTFLGLDVEKVAEPAAELDERLEVMTVHQTHWLSDRIDSAFSHYFSSYAIELARHVELRPKVGDGMKG